MNWLQHVVLAFKQRVRVTLLAGLGFAAWLGNQPWTPKPVLKLFLVAAIRAYRLSLSHLVGRDCLFNPTCSQRALAALREKPLPAAMTEVMAQVSGCNANYALRSTEAGWILTTSNGRAYAMTELSGVVDHKVAAIRGMMAARVGEDTAQR